MAFTALIVAAGRSSRMGRAKAWLTFEGESLLQRIVRNAYQAGASSVVVVAGAEDDEEPDPNLVNRMDVATGVRAPDDKRVSVAIGAPDGHLIDSIRHGFAFVGTDQDVLLWPVDAPFANAELVRALVSSTAERHDQIAVPVVNDKRGHPILLGAIVAEELTGSEADDGAHTIVRRDPTRVVTVTADDPRIVAPLNTPAEARALGITK